MEAMDDLDKAIEEDNKNLDRLTELSFKAAQKIGSYCPSEFMKIEFIADYAEAVSQIDFNYVEPEGTNRFQLDWDFIADRTAKALNDFNNCSEFYRTHRDDLIETILKSTTSALDRMRYMKKLEEMNQNDDEASVFFKEHMLRLFKTLSEWTHTRMMCNREC
jgi:hypothetical protein